MITPQIKHKIKRYISVLLFAAVLGVSVHYSVTVSQASLQTSVEEAGEQGPGQEGAVPGDGEGGAPQDVGPGTGGSGDAEPDAGVPGDTDSEPGDSDGENGADGSGTADINSIMSYTVSRAVQAGIVNADSGLNVRSGPGTNYSKIGSLRNGQAITILSEENGWYKISYGSGVGYVSKEYVDSQDADVDQEYVRKLVADGFPQSYAVLLAGLHAKHPAWVFQPVQTGLDWNTVIEKESVRGINMVPAGSDDSWKSTASGAYNWSTNQWTILDGSSWVGASGSIISYYMDPRNFFNETNIFQFETLQYESYQNEADVSKVLAGTFMSGTLRDDSSKTYASTFVDAGRNAKVNPAHLAVRCKQEQGTGGTSPLISGTYAGYEGYYNYFNIGAYGTPVSVLYQRGLTTAKNNGWNSVHASIVGGASYLAEKYINLGQNTLYFQKFNVTNSYSGLYQHQYMANVQAAESEGRTMGKAYGNKEQAFVFRIPVYKNMPENPCELPSGGNPNNWLKSLAVSGCNLTPAFDGAKTSYSLIVGADVSSVKVSAGPVASTSSVAGTGNINLNYGSNSVKVTCKAQNGAAREYIINIVRQGSAQNAKGDVNGDNKIDLLDMVLVKRHILGIESLSGQKFTAADINGDGKVDLLDCLKVKRHILGYEKIQ